MDDALGRNNKQVRLARAPDQTDKSVPVLKPEGAKPLFYGQGDADLLCSNPNCDFIFAKSVPSSFRVAVSLGCPKCGVVSRDSR